MGECIPATKEVLDRTERSLLLQAERFNVVVTDEVMEFIKHQSNVLAQERTYTLHLNKLLHPK